MSDEIKAYDMGRFQRIVGVEAPNISGKFMVLGGMEDRATIVWPIDATLWFDGRRWGRVYHSEDFSADVKHGATDFSPKDVRDEKKRAEVEELIDELRAVIVAVAEGARYQESVEGEA